MIQIAIEMPPVGQCSVTECAYNAANCCHARAITIGDGVHAGCDTFLGNEQHAKATQRTAGVGACKVSACRHNDDYECVADKITVGHGSSGVCCLTFEPR
jgi:hypothetical protein